MGSSETAIRRGAASERILRALAAEFPALHSRASFIECDALAEAHGKRPGEALSKKERAAVGKALGRLIKDGAVTESLWLHGSDPRVNLPSSGLVGVSVDIVTLREGEWYRTETDGNSGVVLRGPKLAGDRAPTQEAIIDVIIERSKKWGSDRIINGKLPLMVTNAAIVHGSIAFDILVNVSFLNQDVLLEYTREVLQNIPHVRGTQTMLFSPGQGFSNI